VSDQTYRAAVVRGLGARLAFAAMVFVTGWSIWAWADPKPAPGQAANEGTANEGTANEGPAPINWFEFGTETPPFVAMVVNFGVLAAGYYLFGRKPVAAALQSRRDSIAKEIEEAQKMRQEAEVRAKTYQAKLDKLEEEVRTARDALVRAGEAERDRIVIDAEAKAERMHKDALFLVEQELKQIRQDLWRDTLDAAVATAEELLRRGVTQADQERIAEDYLADLGGKLRAERASEQARPAEPGARSPS
jgi:F-type H+-transporting ATPase subunit b